MTWLSIFSGIFGKLWDGLIKLVPFFAAYKAGQGRAEVKFNELEIDRWKTSTEEQGKAYENIYGTADKPYDGYRTGLLNWVRGRSSGSKNIPE